jgi:hypothetical protein
LQDLHNKLLCGYPSTGKNMKLFLVFILIFHASFAVNAQKAEDGHDCEGKGLLPNEEEVGDIEKISSGLEKQSLVT